MGVCTLIVQRLREDSGRVLRLIVGRIITVKLLGALGSLRPYLAAELHAGEWTWRLVLALRLLDRRG